MRAAEQQHRGFQDRLDALNSAESGPVSPRQSAASLFRGVIEVVVVLASATIIGTFAGLNPTSVGFLYLIGVMVIASRRGINLATVTSVVATLLYNFFFFPPLYRLTIDEPANWVALSAFLVASLLINRLLTKAREHAGHAEAARTHLDALQESSELKTSILRAVSHDLNSPLTVLTMELEALRRMTAGHEESEQVARVSEQVAQLHRRIQSLLSLARFEAGAVKPRPEPVPPADLFRSARENLSSVAPMREIRTTVDPDTPDLLVDPSLALEIVANLMENAHRASEPGRPIELRATRASQTGQAVWIEVLDRGSGFPADLRRTDGSVRVSDVSGLGLDIARSFALASGGMVEWLVRPEGGTIARVELPSAPLAAEAE